MSAPPASEATRATHPGMLLALLAFAQLIIALDYNIVFVALPVIAQHLTFSATSLQWVISAYAVLFGGFLMFGGRVADIFGRRRTFVAGLMLYALASLAGGLAQEPAVLVTARAVQGLGGAFLAPATLSLVTTSFAEGPQRNRALSVWGAAGSTGMVLGSLLGGLLAGSLGWESVFFVNVPLAGLAIVATFSLVAPDGVREAGHAMAGAPRRLDVPGAVTSTAGVLAVVYALVQVPTAGLGAASTLLGGLVGVVMLGAFVVRQQRSANPLIPPRLFASRYLTAGTLTTFLFMGSFGAIPYFLTLHLQDVVRLSPFSTGLVFILPSSCVLLGTLIGGRLSNHYSGRAILAGAYFVGTVFTLALAWAMAETAPLVVIALPLAALSLAQGVVFIVMFAVSTTGIPAADQGAASGIATAGQQVGGAVGLALLIMLSSSGAISLAQGTALNRIVVGVVGIAVGLVVGVLVAALVPKPQPVEAAIDSAVIDKAAEAARRS